MICGSMRLSSKFRLFCKALRWELTVGSDLPLPMSKKLTLWRHGFKSHSYFVYGRDEAALSDYVPDTVIAKAGVANGGFRRILDDKLIYADVIGQWLPTPKNMALIQKGELMPLDPDNRLRSADDLLEYCNRSNGLVLKPIWGNRGQGIIKLESRDDRFFVNGSSVEVYDVRNLVRELDNYIAVELVQQATYASQIYPDATNTIRIITMEDVERGDYFVPAAVHRFGAANLRVDNWSRGGLSSKVNLEDGTLGPAVRHPRHTRGQLVWHEVHPDTSMPINGVVVPQWEKIVDELLSAVREIGVIKYAGWDVVVGEGTFWVIEGNSNIDLDLVQVHVPLLTDPRVRKFYAKYGLLSP